jgi:predicted peptidase
MTNPVTTILTIAVHPKHPITMTGKKLYAVRVEYEAYVLAESESEAKSW